MILARVDYLLPIYREASRYDNILEDSIPGNPDKEDLKHIHEHACQIAKPVFEESQKKARGKFEQLHEQQDAMAIRDLEEAVKAAKFGQVDTLFVPLDEHQWGGMMLRTIKSSWSQSLGRKTKIFLISPRRKRF